MASKLLLSANLTVKYMRYEYSTLVSYSSFPFPHKDGHQVLILRVIYLFCGVLKISRRTRPRSPP